jgi:hypothetical protein
MPRGHGVDLVGQALEQKLEARRALGAAKGVGHGQQRALVHSGQTAQDLAGGVVHGQRARGGQLQRPARRAMRHARQAFGVPVVKSGRRSTMSVAASTPGAGTTSRRQRERMVGSSLPGEWLTSRITPRDGGSSSVLSTALAALTFRSSAASMIATR